MYVNPIYNAPILTTESFSMDAIQVQDLDETLTNAIKSALRFDIDNVNDTGTDISSVISIAGNWVTVSDIYVSNEVRTAGNYRICVNVQNPSHSLVREFNIFQEVD